MSLVKLPIVLEKDTTRVLTKSADVQIMTDNLLTIWEDAKLDNQAGLEWYLEAHDFALKVAHQYGVSLHQVVGVISALSPMQRWDVNKRIAIQAIEQFQDSGTISGIHFTKSEEKCVSILSGDREFEFEKYFNPKTAAKTLNFCRCIYNPYDSQSVCIDSHAARIALGYPYHKGTVKIPTAAYNKIASAYIDAAESVNLPPLQFQAILWVYVRKHQTHSFKDVG